MATASRFSARQVNGVGALVVVLVAVGGAVFVAQRGLPAIVALSPTPSMAPSPSLGAVVAPSPSPSTPSASPSSSDARPTGAWIATGSMGMPREDHTAVRLLDGRVLVVGGGRGDQNDLTAELYDPNSGTWSATGSMVKPHADGFPATLLRDGTVLVGEDVEPGTDPSASGIMGAEVYDPASGTWTVTGRMVAPGRGTATLLPDGKGLVVHADSDESRTVRRS